MNATLKTLIAATVFACSLPANAAAPSPQNFLVKLTVNASCTVFNTPDIDMGSAEVNATVEKTGEIRVHCSSGSNPVIALTSANGWTLKRSSADTSGIAYSLQEGSTDWKDNNSRTFVSTGDEKTYSIKAAVASTGNVAGSFSDTVTATLTF